MFHVFMTSVIVVHTFNSRAGSSSRFKVLLIFMEARETLSLNVNLNSRTLHKATPFNSLFICLPGTSSICNLHSIYLIEKYFSSFVPSLSIQRSQSVFLIPKSALIEIDYFVFLAQSLLIGDTETVIGLVSMINAGSTRVKNWILLKVWFRIVKYVLNDC